MELPGYDAWKTTPPDYGDDTLSCDACDHVSEHGWDGDDCPECGEGSLTYNEPAEPCSCTGYCYC